MVDLMFQAWRQGQGFRVHSLPLSCSKTKDLRYRINFIELFLFEVVE